MVYPRRWSSMSVWCGRYRELVYGDRALKMDIKHQITSDDDSD